MSYLLETLGRGLLGRLFNAFENQFPGSPDDDADALADRRRDACTSLDLAIRLGAAYLREERLADARRVFAQARDLDDATHLPALGLACVHEELGETGPALESLREADAGSPNDPAIVFAIGLCHEHRGELGDAVDAYERSIDLCPELRNAHERLAAIAIQAGDWQRAERHYGQLAELDSGDLDVLLTLASLQLQRGSDEDAIESFQRALLIEPESADEQLEAADEFEDEGRLQQAVATVERLVEKYPNVTEFRVHLADLHVKAGDDEEAVAQYRAALELHPSFLEATVKLGTQHLRRQRYEDAAQTFNRAVELNDRLLTAFVGLGVAQQVAKRELDAQATFDLAASLAPNSTLLFSETNRLHLKSERSRRRDSVLCDDPPEGPGADALLVEAINRHQQVLLIHPDRADVHYCHGMLLRQIGNFEAAGEAFEKAVTINPSYVKALIKLGVTWKELGKPDKALDAFTRALRPDEKQIQLHYQLALLFAQYNRFDLALERFERSMTGKEGGAEFRYNVGLALQNVGMVDRAEATWRSICELSRGNNLALACNRRRADRDARRS